jgi:hypothetical protein
MAKERRRGSSTRRYGAVLRVGNETTATLTNLVTGTKYCIVTIAVDAEGHESPPSNELEAVAK